MSSAKTTFISSKARRASASVEKNRVCTIQYAERHFIWKPITVAAANWRPVTYRIRAAHDGIGEVSAAEFVPMIELP